MSPPALVPDNEAERLAKLRALMVLDSGPEPVFDNLVRMASQICGAPIGLLSLVDEARQWFKAQTGLPGVQQTPREFAFCAHAILDETLFEVPDTTLDERFTANPMVTGNPNIRFYAGAPLILPTGERIGTLCVIDRQPRQLSPEQTAMLSQLAQIATDALLMRRDLIQRALSARSEYEGALSSSEALHRSIVEEQTELISLCRPDLTLIYANPAYGRHLGRPPAMLVGNSLLDFVGASDHAIVADRLAWVLATGQPLVSENRMIAADGSEIWVSWTNSLQTQADGGKLLRSVGRDVSARRRAEAARDQSQAFMKRTGQVAGVGGWEVSLPSGDLVWSDETRRIHEVADNFQPTVEQAIGFYPPEVRSEVEAAVQLAIETGQGWDKEWPLVTATGRAIWVHAVGERESMDGQTVRIVGAIQDITTRKQLERQIADNERFVRQITDNLAVRIAYADKDRRYRFVNDEQCRRFALPRDKIIGRSRDELVGTNDQINPYLEAVLEGKAQHFEFDEIVDGRICRAECRLAPDFASDGTVNGYFATAIDITDRSRTERSLRVLTTILEVSTDLVVQTDSQGGIVYMNPAARRMFGLASDAPLDDCNIARFNTDETNRLFAQEMLPAVREQDFWQGEATVNAADGGALPVSHLLIGHRGPDGEIERFSSVMRDFSSEVATRQQSLRQTAILRSVTDALPAIVCAVDSALRFRFVNNAFEKWHGLSREQVVGQPAPDLLDADEVARNRPWIERALGGETVQFERHYAHRPGQPTLAVSLIPVVLEDGFIDGFVYVALDITEHRHEQERLQELAEHDPLTELLNRAGFEARLERALAQGKGAEQALLFIDLDHFKPVNDSHGHLMGDKLLQRFASRLVKLVRPTDTIARLGGDEFAVLLDGVRDLAVAQAVAAKVLDAARQRFKIDGVELQIGASIGVALGSDGMDGGRDLLTRADAHLYRAKQTGRGRQASDASDWIALDETGPGRTG